MERVLINQLDEHNEGGILVAKFLNVTRCIYFYTQIQNKLIQEIKKYYIENLPKIKFQEILIDIGDYKILKETIASLDNTNLVVNLSGGERINSLILSSLCSQNNIKGIYVDIKNKKLYNLIPDFKCDERDYEDLQLVDIVSTSGGVVLSDTSSLIDKKDILYITKKIYSNLDIWETYKMTLYDKSIFNHNYKDKEYLQIDIEKLNNQEIEILNICLKKLKELGGIEVTRNNKIIDVRFLNNYLKAFILKSGTWLEVATHNLINSIQEIDDVKSGVMFLWENDRFSVRNELDVVAIRDSVAICISCKDTDKYDEIALNELNIYATKIGGKQTIKLLVATKEPRKPIVRERAKAMGINIVIFDGDEEKFKNTIRDII